MAQEGQSPVLVFDSPVMVLRSLVLVFTQSSFNFYRVQFWFLHSPVLIFTQCSLFLHSPVLFLHGQQSSFIFCVVTRPLSLYCNIQGGKTFCASFCASLIAGSRRAFLCVDSLCWLCSTVCLFVTERVLTKTEWNAQGVNVCSSKSLFTFVWFLFFVTWKLLWTRNNQC